MIFMLIIFLKPWKYDSKLKIQKDFGRMIQKGLHTKVFFHPFHATNLFLTPENIRKSKVWGV